MFDATLRCSPAQLYDRRGCNRPESRMTFSQARYGSKGYFLVNDFYAWQSARGIIQRNNYHHGSCKPSLTGKTMSVSSTFTHQTHRNVKNR